MSHAQKALWFGGAEDHGIMEYAAKDLGSQGLTAPIKVWDSAPAAFRRTLRLLSFSLHIRRLLRNDELYACINTWQERYPD